MQLQVFVIFFLLTMNTVSLELLSYDDEHVTLIIKICEFYQAKSVIFLYAESIEDMETTTILYKLMRELSSKGFMVIGLNFSELHRSSYYIRKILQPFYISLISDYKAMNKFSLATSNFDMSFAAWLVLFISNEKGPDYCHMPPGNVFHLKFDSKMIVHCNKESILREWYSIDKNKTEINEVASWNLENGIKMIAPKHLYDRRNNLNGMVMRVAIVKNSLFVKLKEDGRLHGMIGKIFDQLCDSLNLTYKVVSEVEQYGAWNPNEQTWTGAVGEVYSGRADMSPFITMSGSRLDAVDFSIPFFVADSALYIKKPQIFVFKWSSFFIIFDNFIWISMFGVLIVASASLIFIKIITDNDRKIGLLLSDHILEIWGIFCQQGLADFSGSSSLRIAYFSIFILAVILLAAYSGVLTSFLTTPVLSIPFRSLEEFIEDGTYQLYVVRDTNIYDLFKNSKIPLAKKLNKFMLEEEKLSTSLIVAFNTVCNNEKIALYISEIATRNHFSVMQCDVTSILMKQIDNFNIILSKNNPFTDVISFQLQKFIDSGLMRYLIKDFDEMKSVDKITLEPIPIASVLPLIFFVLIGIVASICILIIEIYIFTRKKKKIKQIFPSNYSK